MKLATSIQSPAKAAIAVGVSAVLAASLALAAPATAQAKTVKKPAKVKKPTVSKVKATSFKVSWKKAKRAKGYQVKVIKGSKTVKTITVKKKYCYATGLKAKTTYKVKVRAYNKSGKKKKYGKWSAVKKVTTSKQSSSYAGWAGFTWNSKTQTWEYQRPSTGTETHAHSWSTDSCVGGSTRLYYCLQCGELYKDKTDLESHASETEHLQQTWDGYIYEDGIKTTRSSSTQGEYAYSYTTLKNTKLSSASDHCSCGATQAHKHSWKRVDLIGKLVKLNSRYECVKCGWKQDWDEDDIYLHYKTGNCKSGVGLAYYYGYILDIANKPTSGACPKADPYYLVCQDCGLCLCY